MGPNDLPIEARLRESAHMAGVTGMWGSDLLRSVPESWLTEAAAEIERLRGALSVITAEMHEARRDASNWRELVGLAEPVLEYVSRGRRYVDVTKYPDASARLALGAVGEHRSMTAKRDTP